MARLEPANVSEREALKSEIKKEIRQENFRWRLISFGGCSLVVLVALAIPSFLIAATLARTGFYKIPFFTERYYKASSPVRRVLPLVGSNAENTITGAIARSKFDQHTSLLRLTLTETELTTIMQEAVRKAKDADLPFPVRDVQIAFDDEVVEIFAVSPQEAGDATVRARFVPSADRGTIDFRVQEVRVGDLALPRWMAQAAFSAAGNAMSKAILAQSDSLGTLFRIEFSSGSMRFFIMPKNLP